MLDTRITVIQSDITTLKVDAIINAANTSLLGGSGVDGLIHKIGGKQLLQECILIRNKSGGCKIGEAVITSGGNLPAKFVIHTVGPVWIGGNNHEEELLSKCYLNSLRLALKYEIKTIAFPNISTGRYKFPKDKASKIAIEVVNGFLQNEPRIIQVFFVCFDDENYNIYKKYLL